MRTNIVLNDDLVREAMRYSRARTRRALVEEALSTFVAVKAEEQQRMSYRERLHGLRTKLGAVKLRQAPSKLLREDRERA
jgi:Arc/MetJ family transcription regulator